MSDVFNKLSSSLINNEFIESLISSLVYTNDDRLLFLAQKALENGFFNDPLIIQNEIYRKLLREISMLRTKGASGAIVKEALASNIEKYRNLVDLLDRNKNVNSGDMFLNDMFLDKIKNQVVVKNLQKIGSLLSGVDENTKTSSLLDSLEKVLTEMLMEMNINLDFREMTLNEIKKRIKNRKNRNKDESKVKVPTGLLHLDENILFGGVEKGRLVVIASSPGYGKSTVVANSAVQGSKRGFNAWVITLENSLIETWARIDSSITDIQINDLDSMSDQVEKKVTDFSENPNHGELLVKEFPPDTMTVSMLKNYIIQKVSQGFKKPDIIFVDYLDIIRPEKNYAQLRFELSHITKSLKKLASDFDCVLVVPTQLNRGAVGEDGESKGGLSNLAEAFAKSFEPDLLLVIRQSKNEIKNSKFRLFIAKSRISQSRLEIICDVNYAKMKIKTTGIQYPGDDGENLINNGNEISLDSLDELMKNLGK